MEYKFSVIWEDLEGNAANIGLDGPIEGKTEEEAREIAEYNYFLDRDVMPEEGGHHAVIVLNHSR